MDPEMQLALPSSSCPLLLQTWQQGNPLRTLKQWSTVESGAHFFKCWQKCVKWKLLSAIVSCV
eukprot:6027100-Prorocentrum_lima.AAC.1